jgi:photosystem II stability/assembly factor-like uncharacterized protein
MIRFQRGDRRHVVLVVIGVLAAALFSSLASTAYAAGWVTQTSGTTMDLSSLFFTDATHGWAVGLGGTVLKTADGGTKWTVQQVGAQADLTGVFFSDATHGWIVGSGGTILKTTDGGATWSALPPTNSRVTAVDFVNPTVGWALISDVTGTSSILKTTDGGTTWNPQASFRMGDTKLVALFFADAHHGWATGGAMYATTDGGDTWTTQTSGEMATGTQFEGGESIFFTDATHGWIVGVGGTILKTSDGGATWTAQKSGTTDTLWSVMFTDQAHGWVVGGSNDSSVGRPNLILATTNGGATWKLTQNVAAAGGNTLGSIFFTDATHGWAVGRQGTIISYDPNAPAHPPPLPAGTRQVAALRLAAVRSPRICSDRC